LDKVLTFFDIGEALECILDSSGDKILRNNAIEHLFWELKGIDIPIDILEEVLGILTGCQHDYPTVASTIACK